MKKLAFFCSGGMGPECPYTAEMTYLPRRASDWDACVTDDLEITFYVILPGTHVVDALAGKLTDTPEKVRYVPLSLESSVDEIADLIAEYQPDVAVALSVPEVPYDWDQVRDAIIAQKLKERGIRTISHTPDTAMLAFEKFSMNELLSRNGFHVAKHFLVNANLYFAQQDPGVLKNLYREYVSFTLSKFRFPVVIKPDCSAGSVGVSVAKTLEEAEKILAGGDPHVDVIVEEWIKGDNFGVEIYGAPGKYLVTPAIMFSASEEGVTDPFASVKFGPVLDEKYEIEALDREMHRLAELLQLEGAAEIDLMFSEGKWYIIEVNPRYSLLTLMPASMRGKSVFAPYVETALGEIPAMDRTHLKQVVDFKAQMLSDERMQQLKDSYPFITYIMRFRLAVTKTEEVGYCEFVVIGDTKEELMKHIDLLKKNEPDLMGDLTYQNLVSML
ncbi:MAG: ATP-grasp domain-containing protein [Lachnospiraceae bacterium]|nr:ATP-grasp domain-containing protein [Lachnospiraceae bacterium]